MNGRYLRKVEGRRKRRETVTQQTMVSGSEAVTEASLTVSLLRISTRLGSDPIRCEASTP